MAGLTDDELDFMSDLDDLIERAIVGGICVEFITKSLSQHGADLATSTWTRIIDLCIKCWIVCFCSVTPAAIFGWKCYAAAAEKKYYDDPWLNLVCLISLLAVVSQFFNLKAVLPILDRLIRTWKQTQKII